MTNQDKHKVVSLSKKKPFTEMMLSGTLTTLIAILALIISIFIDVISTLSIFSKIPNQFFVFSAIIFSLVTVIPFSLYLVIKYYKIQTLHTEKAINRLKEKETDFFNDVEANWTALTGKGQ